MNERLRNWLPLLPLLLLLGATYWLNMQVQPTSSNTTKSMRHDPDFIIDNFNATTLDKSGKTRFVMSARKMVHYPDNDTTWLESPKISSYASEYPPMNITASRGEISSKGEDIYLHDQVSIIRPPYANKGESTFHTDYLHVQPDENRITTDRSITMTDARSSFTAVGMELDNKLHIVKFLSQVRSTHEARKK